MRTFLLRYRLAALAAAVLLSACGGGDATAPGGGSSSSSGFAVDGYLNGANVVCDTNGNGLADTGERTVSTDSSGFFTFSPACTSALIATGGTSIDTGLPFIGKLRAPAGATVITPLTSLIAAGGSQSAIIASLGITNTGTLIITDPARMSAGSLVDVDLMKKTLVIQQFAQKLTEVFAGLATSASAADRQAIYGEVMAALASALAANPSMISGGTISEAGATALIKAVVDRVKTSTTLPAAIVAGVAGLNSDSLAQVIVGALKVQGEAILGAAGNALTATTKTQQESTAITTFIQTNKASLTGAPNATTAGLASSLRAQLTQEVPATPTNLITNGNFSNGATGWSGNAANVLAEGGNSFNFASVASAGNAYDVNLSYVLNIPNSGVAYKLRFKASSNRARTMLAGIGLNQDPWTNVTQQVNLTTTQQTFELSLTSNFASSTSRVIFDMGADTGNVVIDDVELVLDTSAAPAPAGGPTAAASAPTAASANVKSIFSDSYTNVVVNEWGPDWGPASSRITDGVIAGNNYKTIDMTAGKEFAGISFAGSKFNATAYTTFHMDYWIDAPLLAGQVITIKLSNHDGSGETNAIQYLVNPVTAGSWQRLAIPLSSFEVAGGGSASRNNIAQIIITAARANVATTAVKVHFDNLYFSQ